MDLPDGGRSKIRALGPCRRDLKVNANGAPLIEQRTPVLTPSPHPRPFRDGLLNQSAAGVFDFVYVLSRSIPHAIALIRIPQTRETDECLTVSET